MPNTDQPGSKPVRRSIPLALRDDHRGITGGGAYRAQLMDRRVNRLEVDFRLVMIG